METFKSGDNVKYTGCSDDQFQWGRGDNPKGILIVGDKYYVEKVEIHNWHTILYLRGIYGKYNSVCFEKLKK